MWIDSVDWRGELERRRAGMDAQLVADIETFARDGVVIFPGAAKERHVDAFERVISEAFANGSEHLLCQYPADHVNRPITAGTERRGLRVVDAYVALPEALDLFSSERLLDFLKAIFGEDPLLFQGISFDRGSEQGIHQDTAYVVVDRPMELAACWIALEDIKPGSGELIYLRGSHRFVEEDFFNGKKHWAPADDGPEPHNRWSQWIMDSAAGRGITPEPFLAKKGDILVWHADLAHGGSAIKDPSLTRKSLVGHFCPASATPYYFVVQPDRRTLLRRGPLRYSSYHYDLAKMGSRSRPLLDRVKARLGLGKGAPGRVSSN
jgi:hypothetical protein